MKKTILPIFLFSLSAFAQDYKSFFTSFDPSVSITKEELKSAIKRHLDKPNSYLTLGETHLESESVHMLQKEFVDVFLESMGGRGFTYCSEKIDTWFESEAGKILEKEATAIKKFTGSRFDKCEGPENSNYLNYAGAFHLFPYARGFKYEFLNHPVIDKDTINIRAQMKKGVGFFIPQFELNYLEARASAALLSEVLSVEEFRKKAKVHLDQSLKIRKSMAEVLDGDIYSGKMGVIMPKDAFANNVLMPKDEEFYFFITNRHYRDMEYAHHFVQKLLAFEDSILEKFLNLSVEKKGFFGANYFTREMNGFDFPITIEYLDDSFNGESQYLKIGDYIFVSEPNVKDLECFFLDFQVECSEIFNSL